MTPELRADVEQFVDILTAKGEQDVQADAVALRRHLNQNSLSIAHHVIICLKTIRYTSSYTKKFDADDRIFVTELLHRLESWKARN